MYFNLFVSTSGLTYLIMNSVHALRSSSDSVVTGLLCHRKIVAGTRDCSILNFPHTVSYGVPGGGFIYRYKAVGA